MKFNILYSIHNIHRAYSYSYSYYDLFLYIIFSGKER